MIGALREAEFGHSEVAVKKEATAALRRGGGQQVLILGLLP